MTLLALATLSPSARAIFWFVAFFCFAIATFVGPWAPAAPARWYVRANLLALGLAVWALMNFWIAVAAS